MPLRPEFVRGEDGDHCAAHLDGVSIFDHRTRLPSVLSAYQLHSPQLHSPQPPAHQVRDRINHKAANVLYWVLIILPYLGPSDLLFHTIDPTDPPGTL